MEQEGCESCSSGDGIGLKTHENRANMYIFQAQAEPFRGILSGMMDAFVRETFQKCSESKGIGKLTQPMGV